VAGESVKKQWGREKLLDKKCTTEL